MRRDTRERRDGRSRPRRRQDSRTRWSTVIYPPDHRTLPGQLVDQLRRRIGSGDLGPGARLPPEQDFAAQLGVSHGVLREALHTLAYLGLIERSGRRGTVVSRPSHDVGLLRASFGRASLLELHDLRAALEPAAAERASQRRSSIYLNQLWGGLMELGVRQRSRVGPQAYVEADVYVHRLIVAAGGNSVAAAIHRALMGAIRADLEHRYPALVVDEELHGLHVALARAVDEGDGPGARDAAAAITRREAPQIPVDEPAR